MARAPRLTELLASRHAEPWQHGDGELKRLGLVHCRRQDRGNGTTELLKLEWMAALIVRERAT